MSERVQAGLLKPLVQAGVLREPGEAVILRPDQAERLAAAGIVEPMRPPHPARRPRQRTPKTT